METDSNGSVSLGSNPNPAAPQKSPFAGFLLFDFPLTLVNPRLPSPRCGKRYGSDLGDGDLEVRFGQGP